MIEIRTVDGDCVILNPIQLSFHKGHPDSRKPRFGIVVMSSGHEFILDLADYTKFKKEVNEFKLPFGNSTTRS